MLRKINLILVAFLFLSFKTGTYRPVHLFMIGDSTMADKSWKAMPETGWGQVLHYFFNDSVVVKNYAKNGRSSKSFINEGLWDSVINNMQQGDYLVIQFGHNDNKPDPKRHTDPFTTYTANLEKFISESKAKGAIPVLCTPIIRRHFNEKGELINTHGDFLTAVKNVAENQNVYFIDMEEKSRVVVSGLGMDKSKGLFMFVPPGIYPNRPRGASDSTHLTQLGAFTMASQAVNEMKSLGMPVARYLKKY